MLLCTPPPPTWRIQHLSVTWWRFPPNRPNACGLTLSTMQEAKIQLFLVQQKNKRALFLHYRIALEEFMELTLVFYDFGFFFLSVPQKEIKFIPISCVLCANTFIPKGQKKNWISINPVFSLVAVHIWINPKWIFMLALIDFFITALLLYHLFVIQVIIKNTHSQLVD